MLKQNLDAICSRLDLGSITTSPTQVTGGLLHEMWQITTTKESYAVKILNPKIMQKPDVVERYEITETIARMFFQKGIPAIISIVHDNKSVIEVDGAFFIVYPWVNGSMLGTHTTNEEYAQKIAAIVSRMHQLNIQLPKPMLYTWDMHPNSYFEDLIAQAIKNDLPFASTLSDISAPILTWNEKYHLAIAQLNKHTLISHGDLDQKNVLWTHNHEPMIIDWEAARLVNPTQEIISVSLDWSGLPSGTIDTEIFTSMINAYKNAGGIINKDDIQASFGCIIGNCLNWLAFNIERSLDDNDKEKLLGIAQVQQALDILPYLTSHVEKLVHLL